jgi:hypothetical protein
VIAASIAAGVVSTILGVLLLRWWDRRRRRRRTGKATSERLEECVCGLLVGGADLHLVVAVQDDDVLAAEGMAIMGAGTAMSATFCAEHCPGGCLNPRHA